MGRRCQRETAVPTSEMKISKNAERGKEERGEGRERGERGEFGVAVPCATSVPFQVFHQPHQFFAICPRSEAEGDAPSLSCSF